MSTDTKHDYRDTCTLLERAIQDLQVRIRVSEQNLKLKQKYDTDISKLENNIGICNNIIDVIKPLLADSQEYIAKRRKEAMSNINNALRLAGEIIPDATEGIYFNVEGDEAWLSTPDGLEVQVVEGGGFRQISSSFVRSVVVASSIGTMNTLFLDEVFSLVSPENSATLSLYMNILCQEMQIISIEQKPQVYSNIDHVRYTFSKSGDYTDITYSEVSRDETVGGDLVAG